ncbi:MAG: molybdopterin molybdotransferase MoeA [Pyrinomonadaceae bacterium]|nr:molybdopterin molybdotransferase MoeA [Pyrinomonadaceae bacterium]
MIPISDALNFLDRETIALPADEIKLEASVGRILAENVRADLDLPPFDRSQMDGFAVRVEDVRDAPVDLEIIGESVAGKGFGGEVNSGEAVRIMTGAPVPSGADSVQMVELTESDGDKVTIKNAAKPEQNIVPRAAEVKAGTVVLEKGEIITKNMIATLASFGYYKINVSKRPCVKILATGSEIVDISEKPAEDQIRNSNSWMIAEFAKKYADVEMLPIIRDDLESLKSAIREAASSCDCLIISGGVSVGDYDFTKPALRELGAEIFFEKVSLKPGKPTVFAKLGETLIFGLPGNPVSVAVTFYVFARTALLRMQGAKFPELNRGFAKLLHPIKSTKGRDALLPASFSTDSAGHLTIETLRFSGSSNFITFARAEGLVFVPAGVDLNAGEVAEIYFFD